MWWWVDGTAAYGMLVQAKRLTIKSGAWGFDFMYPQGTGGQKATLLSVAALLGLLPVFSLYLGTGAYRSWSRALSAISASVAANASDDRCL